MSKIKIGYTTKRDIKAFISVEKMSQIATLHNVLKQKNEYMYFYILEDELRTTYKNVKIVKYNDKYILLSKKQRYKHKELYSFEKHTLCSDVFCILLNNRTKRLQIQINKDYVRSLKLYISMLKKIKYIKSQIIHLSEEDYERIIRKLILQLKELSKYILVYNDTKKSICKHIQRERILFYTSIAKRKLSKVPKFDCHI